MTYSAAAFKTVSMRSRAALCALLGLCLLTGLPPRAGATVASSSVVTRTADDTLPGSLRYAIGQASGTGGTVTFAIPATDPGYSSAANTDTVTLSLGQLNVPGSLTIAGPSAPAATVVVSGAPPVFGQQSVNASRVFSVTGGTVTFSNLTIQSGSASPNNVNFPETGGGGGILNSATLTLNNCQVGGNATTQLGGGILNTATLTLNNCQVNGNAASGVIFSSSGNSTGPGGGGINNSGSGASLTLTGCTLSQNNGPYGAGGIENSGTMLLSGCLLASNVVSNFGNGGGLYNTGTATLSGCTLYANLLDGQGDGGGAYNSGSLTLSGCLLDNNNATFGGRGGGGIENDTGGALVMSACTVSRSQADLSGGAGGINNFGSAQITDCLVLNNVGNYVGGMFNTGSLTLINSTFTGNLSAGNYSGPFAGGLLSGPASLVNDIFYFDFENYLPNYPDPSEIAAYPGPAGPTVTYSDVQQPTGVFPGAGNINLDPLFVRNPLSSFYVPLDDPGDEHLQIISPAVHAGTNGPGIPLTDIQGNPRPAAPATPSMGAYEIPATGGGFNAQGGFAIAGVQGQSTGAQVVAEFLPGTTPAASFTAAISFGDGSAPVAGTIAPDPSTAGLFDVTGSHTYAATGTFTITVVISGPGGSPTATVTTTAIIQPVDVTSLVGVNRGGLVYNRATKRYVQTVTITNTSGAALAGPFSLVLDGLTPGAVLLNPSGTTQAQPPAGSPYQNAAAGSLAPGASLSLVLQFTYAGTARFGYAPRVLAGPGAR